MTLPKTFAAVGVATMLGLGGAQAQQIAAAATAGKPMTSVYATPRAPADIYARSAQFPQSGLRDAPAAAYGTPHAPSDIYAQSSQFPQSALGGNAGARVAGRAEDGGTAVASAARQLSPR